MSHSLLQKPLSSIFWISALLLCCNQLCEANSKSDKSAILEKIRFQNENILILADTVHIDRKSGILKARGNVQVQKKNLLLLSEYIEYKIKDNYLASKKVKLLHSGTYIEAKNLEIKENLVTAEDAKIYPSEPTQSIFELRSKAIRIVNYDTLELESPRLYLNSKPILELPSKKWTKSSKINWTSKAGYRSRSGAFIQNKFTFPKNENLELGANFDFYSKQGYLLGPVFKYKLQQPQNSIRWDFNSGFSRNKNNADDIFGGSIPQSRFFIQSTFFGTLGSNIDGIGKFNKQSDPDILLDTRHKQNKRDSYLENFLETTYRDKNWIFSVSANRKVNDWIQTNQHLPEFSFYLLPDALGKTNIQRYFEVHGSVLEDLYQKEISTPESSGQDSENREFIHSKTSRLQTHFQISLSKNGDLVHLKPTLGFTSIFYNSTAEEYNNKRLLGEVGFDAETTMAKIWSLDSPVWKINGLRHIIRPKLQYRYIDRIDKENRKEFKSGIEPLILHSKPIGLAGQPNIDSLNEESKLRVGLESELQTRHESYGSRSLLTLGIYQDFYFNRTIYDQNNDKMRGSSSDTLIELSSKPAYWLNTKFYSRISTEKNQGEEIDFQIKIQSRDQWHFIIEKYFIEDNLEDIDQYRLQWNYRINARCALNTKWIYDANLNKAIHRSYALSLSFSRHLIELEFKNFTQKEEKKTQVGISWKFLDF